MIFICISRNCNKTLLTHTVKVLPHTYNLWHIVNFTSSSIHTRSLFVLYTSSNFRNSSRRFSCKQTKPCRGFFYVDMWVLTCCQLIPRKIWLKSSIAAKCLAFYLEPAFPVDLQFLPIVMLHDHWLAFYSSLIMISSSVSCFYFNCIKALSGLKSAISSLF